MQIWIVPCFLILLMQAGFALFETGMCRSKNSAHTMSMTLLAYALGVTAFWVCGYALMCGGAGSRHHAIGSWGNFADVPVLKTLFGVRVGGHWWGLVGARGFFLTGGASGSAEHDLVLTGFLFMMLFMSVAATIPTGAMVERWRFKSFCLFTLLVGAVIFPLYGCWMWGGGWLAALGRNLGIGHGAIDYAGSSVVHLLGGTLALAGVLQLGPRVGKYDEVGNPRPIFGHNVPMTLLGTMLLAFAWFGFNTSQSFAAADGRAGAVAVNTAMSSVAGALAAAMFMVLVYGKPDPSVMCNGMLSALVASCASCAYVEPWAAFLIGAVAGVLAAMGVLFLERRGIDDPVGAISVHGIGGLWGMLALGLFANGTFGHGTHGVDGPVRGLFYGDAKQLLAQLIAAAVCIVWAFGTGALVFRLIRLWLGSNRVPIEVEIAGLDIPEMGAPGYPEFTTHLAPEQVPLSQTLTQRRR
ncbi:MAG TPA: ammonium transporter [Tepidisphaeraceae bacterium]|jgi:Amt family ammonium transporter|nr:ammonium transporter [Tepidisphaeraceae bacterium]